MGNLAMMKPQNPNRVQAWSYVYVQALLLMLLVLVDKRFGPGIPRILLLGWVLEFVGIVGVLVCAASLGRSLTAVPLPKEDGQLSTARLYRYVRHPMYSSVLIFALGIAVDSGSAFKYLLTVFLYILFHFKSVYEEKYLRLKYPDYASYAERIPRFIPFTK